ncbi:MAG: extracellular solute-binding protein [Erysipelotrichaceae bacterium]|nr:extracellular solute-binding protein [Erysipelotrichaceae bacterium]
MKKLLVSLLAMLVSFNLVACSSNKEETKTAESGTETTDLTQLEAEITWWAFPTFKTVDGVAGKYEESLVAAFNEKYPNIKVNVEMIDFQNGPEKIVTAIQGGTAPDVLFDAPGRIIDYGTSGYLVPLNDLYAETGLEADIASKNILQASSDGTNYWMYPTSAAPFVMAVNKTALEEAGLLDKVNLEGDRTWTTEEFIALSKEMASKGYKGVEIYAGAQGGDQGTRAFISNLTGAKIMNEDLTKYTMDTTEGVEAYKLVKQGVDEGWLTSNTAGAANDALDHFSTPTSATFWAVALWSPNLHVARQAALDESKIEAVGVSLPSKDGKPTLEYLVNGYAIFNNKDETKIQAAKEFVKFLADDEVIGKQNVVATNCFPVRKSFGDLYEGDANMQYYASLSGYYGSYYNTVNGFASMRPFWWQSLQAMLTGDKTPEDAAAYFTNNANETLDE